MFKSCSIVATLNDAPKRSITLKVDIMCFDVSGLCASTISLIFQKFGTVDYKKVLR